MIARIRLMFAGTLAALICLILVAAAPQNARADETVLVPRIEGDWWQVAGSPDLGQFTTDRQQPVDFAIWQAADGTWQLWSCIRSTSYPGWTRLFYRWQGKRLTDRDWRPMGIAMTSDVKLGEVEGMLQAPYVMRRRGQYLMFYGTGDHVALATSRDGKTFQRRLLQDGTVGMFSDGFGTRDPMTILVDGTFHTYYSANPGTVFDAKDSAAANRSTLHLRENADLMRTSTDLLHWSEPKTVAEGGAAGTGSYSAECPFVYFHKPSGYYYLFRTQHYGQNAETRVYRSKDPADFGINDDRYLVETLPVAAVEIVESHGQSYIAALLPSLKGIQIAKLDWEHR
ncbi:MAG TPA: hypothetical protein VHZ32_19825 [Rhizomicrobium sp.]|nr:hypothetical protein [Rhizomicrobium sp.]